MSFSLFFFSLFVFFFSFCLSLCLFLFHFICLFVNLYLFLCPYVFVFVFKQLPNMDDHVLHYVTELKFLTKNARMIYKKHNQTKNVKV